MLAHEALLMLWKTSKCLTSSRYVKPPKSSTDLRPIPHSTRGNRRP